MTTASVSALDVPLNMEHHSPNYGGNLTVVQLSYGRVTENEVVSGAARPIVAWLSSDGRSFITPLVYQDVYADTPTPIASPAVYIEKHDESGCIFHGWIDPATRKLVQAG